MEIEIWKDIPGYEGLYQASNLGRIKSIERLVNYRWGYKKLLKGSVLRYYISTNGYTKYVLSNNIKKTCSGHVLVASAFIPQIEGKNMVNHKDGNKTNNKVENLEWCTCAENMRHAYRTGLMKSHMKGKFGALSPTAKPVKQFDKKGKFIREFVSGYEAERVTGVIANSISSACTGRKKSAGGFIWQHSK